MADKKEPASPVSPLKASDGPPESPTTARPLDFDSDQEGGLSTPVKSESAPKPPPKDEVPPAKPPRPLSPREQAENTLKEAFPSIDAAVVKAVLAASGGQVEPAFNALLGMSDPDSVREPEPPAPAMPPRPPRGDAAPQSQLDADEQYARQLQEHYSNSEGRRSGGGYNEHLQGSRPGQGRPGANPDPADAPWRSFIDDDLPEIRDNIRQGFFETQKTVNSWITSFKKKLDGEEDDQDYNQPPPRQSQPYARQGSQPYGRQSSEMRRSADMQRYDADPQVIGDDFSKLDLRDGEAPPRTSSRPLANPNLFKSDGRPRKSPTGSGRKVSFQDGPPEEIGDMYSGNDKSNTSTAPAPASNTKSSKWQPLSQVEPSPVDNDPFSLGDSDDDKDAKPITLKDGEEDERVKKATSEAMTDTLADKKDAGK